MERAGTIGLVGLVVALLGWNVWTVQTLKDRIAVLEAAPAGLDAAHALTTRSAERKAASERRVGVSQRRSIGSAARSADPDRPSGERVAAADAVLLGIDDPEVKAAFDEYLDEFIDAKREARSELDESNYLDHMATTVEVYCEELNLPEEMQDRLVVRFEAAHERWTGADAAHEAGEIDRREMLEIHGQIEEAVNTEMVELLGQESWEELMGRIWG
ncbi:MAG TPA: hypothetical protein DFR83_00770 [Deltaproteobacteria bacterium]|nr:hypothetical protein [Deltaproteobacteria bacterium]